VADRARAAGQALSGTLCRASNLTAKLVASRTDHVYRLKESRPWVVATFVPDAARSSPAATATAGRRRKRNRCPSPERRPGPAADVDRSGSGKVAEAARV